MNKEMKNIQTEAIINLLEEAIISVKNEMLDSVNVLTEQVDSICNNMYNNIYDMAENIDKIFSEYKQTIHLNKEEDILPIKEGLFGVVEFVEGYDTFLIWRKKDDTFYLIFGNGGFSTIEKEDKESSFNFKGKSYEFDDTSNEKQEVAEIVMLLDVMCFDDVEEIYNRYNKGKLSDSDKKRIVWTCI